MASDLGSEQNSQTSKNDFDRASRQEYSWFLAGLLGVVLLAGFILAHEDYKANQPKSITCSVDGKITYQGTSEGQVRKKSARFYSAPTSYVFTDAKTGKEVTKRISQCEVSPL